MYLKIFLSIILILSSSLAQAQTFEGKQTVNKLIVPEINTPTGTLTLGGTGGENLTLDFETVENEVGIGTGTGVTVTKFLDGMKLQVNSLGNDKNIQVYHDDTDGAITTSSGDLVITPNGGAVNVVGAISSATLTVTSSADNTDVSGVNTMWVTTTGGAVVLGGLTGGVDGQVLYVVRKDTTNDLTLENAEGAGDQDFIMHQSADEVIDAGGAVLMCDGSDWYDISHARHV